MLFKPRFFLDLGSEGETQKPATIAPPVTAAPAKPAAAKSGPASQPVAATTAVAADKAAAPEAPSAPSSSQTTAEAIAAELAAAQANRPAPSLVTFAPDCVTPGGAQPRRRRRGGADLAGFRDMAQGMMRS
ncbi:MAG: hypothetical protein ACKOXO_01360 [Cyanobium sp.]